jgi:ParB-like chromosome segregation protein Spo0J
MNQTYARDLEVEHLPIADLKLDPRNPRRHSDLQVRQIAESIKSFSFNVPVLVDGKNLVVSGHGRVLAARKLGWHSLPVIRLKHLSPEQCLAFGLADNRLTENSTWDDRLLGEILHDLATVDLDVSLEATGFSVGEIDLRIEALSSSPQSEDPADQIAPIANQSLVSEPSDLWLWESTEFFVLMRWKLLPSES